MRIQGWENKLHETLERIGPLPYKLGESDCGTMCLEVTKAITGLDYGVSLEGKYTSHISMMRFVSAMSRGEGIADALEKLSGLKREPPLKARRGDVALFKDREGKEHLAIVAGAQVLTKGPNCLVPFPLEQCEYCWRT